MGALKLHLDTCGVAALAAIRMAAWDRALDPVMTRMSFRVWKACGPYRHMALPLLQSDEKI